LPTSDNDTATVSEPSGTVAISDARDPCSEDEDRAHQREADTEADEIPDVSVCYRYSSFVNLNRRRIFAQSRAQA
jgi:hypothetical protein